MTTQTFPILSCFFYPCLFLLFVFSVSSAGSSTGRRRKQRTIPTNDELLYDPDEDDRDQAWVDARRRLWETLEESLIDKISCPKNSRRLFVVLRRYNGIRRAATGSQQQPHQSQALPSSDAVLNCPACMTTLCLDCQRWELALENEVVVVLKTII